jgi:hypothetical protein
MEALCSLCRSEAGFRITGIAIPCGHFFCINCINEQCEKLQRTWNLPCQVCQSTFAVVQPQDFQCSKKYLLRSTVVDKYLNVITQQNEVLSDGKAKIMGLAFKQQTQELFVVSKANMCVKFNIPATDNTPVQRMTLEVQRLIYPRGIAFSQLHDSLYIIDWVKMSSGALIVYRIANSGSTTINIDAQPFGVSTLEKKNKVDIYVTCSSCQIIVFCDDGRAVNKSRRLHLPSSFQLPRHAVPLCQPAAADDGGRDVETFVVCWMSKRISCVSKVRTSNGDKDKLEEVAVYGTTGWCEFVTRQSYANSLILFPLAAQKLKHI